MGRYASLLCDDGYFRELDDSPKLSTCLANAAAYIVGSRRVRLASVLLSYTEVQHVVGVLRHMHRHGLFDPKDSGPPKFECLDTQAWHVSHVQGILRKGEWLNTWLMVADRHDKILFA